MYFSRLYKDRLYNMLIAVFVIASIFGRSSSQEDDVFKSKDTVIEDGVLVLTHDNFDLEVNRRDLILVEFYAPWCGYCKQLEPEYAKAAAILKKEDPLIPLAKIDGSLETEIASRYDVTGFPTLFLFRKGVHESYFGERTTEAIVEFMTQQSKPYLPKPPTADAVITLTAENFTDIVDNSELILVEFYAPWCGHCKRLAPEYERAAKELKDLPKPIRLAKVDATTEKELADKYSVSGYPTFYVFRNGKKYEYAGPRDKKGIISYMKNQGKPPSEEILTAKVKNSFSKTEITVVGFFNSPIDALYSEFLESGHKLREKFSFYHTFSQTVAKEFGSVLGTIAVIHPEIFQTIYEPNEYIFSKKEASHQEITGFIRENCVPLVGERSHKTQFKYEGKYPLVVIYYDVDFSFEHRIRTQKIRNEVAKVAKNYRGKITFVVSNEEDYEEELTALGLDDSGEDVNVGFYYGSKIRFAMPPPEVFTATALEGFISDVASGKVKRQIKSAPEPPDNKGPVVAIVGSTFEKLVSSSEKDVLFEFYAPWCGHCKELEPIYLKLAKEFQGNDRILIAKMDATTNDYPAEFEVQGYPSIFYIPASDKRNPVVYNGDRSLTSLTDFLNKHLGISEKEEL